MRCDGSVSFVEAATTEPLGTSLHAVNLAEPKDGEIHVIVGAGIIGLGVLQCLEHQSAARTVVVDISDKRLAMASELGADLTLNASKTDLVLTMMGSGLLGLDEMLAGKVDAVYDCAGLTKSFEGTSVLSQATSIVKEDGKVIVVAVFEKQPEIDWNLVVRKGVRLFGSWAWSPERAGRGLTADRLGEDRSQAAGQPHLLPGRRQRGLRDPASGGGSRQGSVDAVGGSALLPHPLDLHRHLLGDVVHGEVGHPVLEVAVVAHHVGGLERAGRHVVLGGGIGELVALPGVVADHLAGLDGGGDLGPQLELAHVVVDADRSWSEMPRSRASDWLR